MTTHSDYQALQASIDKVIGKIGLQRTVCLVDSFINAGKISSSKSEKIKMLRQFLVTEACAVFDIQLDVFYSSSVREYRDARMVCIHLLRKYTNDSFPKIGIAFQCGDRVVAYRHRAAEDRLAMPKGNTVFVAKYTLIETRLIEFMAKIS